jgi:hypothetical protein
MNLWDNLNETLAQGIKVEVVFPTTELALAAAFLVVAIFIGVFLGIYLNK